MLLVGLSIIIQYQRIFVPTPHLDAILYYGCHIVIWASILFYSLAAIVSIFLCKPIEKAWDPLVAGRYLDDTAVDIATSVFRTFFEFLILLLSLPTIWRLKMRLPKKLAISALIGTGLL